MPSDAPIKADQFLDCRGQVCPLPLLRTRRAIEGMRAGQVLAMTATDVATIVDIQAWTRRTGHRLLTYTTQDDTFTFYIKKVR